VNAVNPSPQLRAWLTEPGSLTARLIAHSAQFRVQRIRQSRGLLLADELPPLQLGRRVIAQQRQVVLECDAMPVVFAQSSVPLSANASDWPMFGHLGERSLGSTLFGDPLVQRGALEFARLLPSHPLVRSLQATLGKQSDVVLFARRCLYRRHRGLLLVSEIFLPAIVTLALAPNAA
jgi:chorismate--pyruvate lyase